MHSIQKVEGERCNKCPRNPRNTNEVLREVADHQRLIKATREGNSWYILRSQKLENLAVSKELRISCGGKLKGVRGEKHAQLGWWRDRRQPVWFDLNSWNGENVIPEMRCSMLNSRKHWLHFSVFACLPCKASYHMASNICILLWVVVCLFQWHRACFVLKYLRTLLEKSGQFRGEHLMTTRQLVHWCRHHAFSPCVTGMWCLC